MRRRAFLAAALSSSSEESIRYASCLLRIGTCGLPEFNAESPLSVEVTEDAQSEQELSLDEECTGAGLFPALDELELPPKPPLSTVALVRLLLRAVVAWVSGDLAIVLNAVGS